MFALNIFYWVYFKGIHIDLLKYIILICINSCIEVYSHTHIYTAFMLCIYLVSQAFIYCSKTIVPSLYLRGKTINSLEHCAHSHMPYTTQSPTFKELQM